MHFYSICLLFSFFSFSLAALQVSNLSSIDAISPGEKKRFQIKLINDRDESEQIDLTLTDYRCNSSGEHFFDQPSGKAERSNASWIHLGQERVTLAPQEVRDIFYTVEVPKNENLKGSYWSVLLIEPTEALPSKDDEKEGFKLRIKVRYAHHIVTNVQEASPKLKVLQKEIKEISGEPYLVLHVVNQGELFINPELTFTLYDKEGKLEKTLKAQPERLYPGNPQSFYVPLKELSKERLQEPLKGFIMFDGHGNHLFGDQFTYP